MRRVLIKAAEESGLPFTEQRIFADALLAQYPAVADRSWKEGSDPTPRTPRGNVTKVETSDFNFFLFRQLLNENPSARALARRGKKIQIRELKNVKGQVFSESSIDDLTKIELARWQQDFIYRGGELGTGREAPISRQGLGLVPALEEPATKPDITWIPRIMRSNGWNEGAILMEEWQRRPANTRPANLKDVPNNFGPPVLNVVTYEFGFKY